MKPTKPSASTPPKPALRLDRPRCGAARTWGYLQLKKSGVDSFVLDADLILAAVLGIDRQELRLNRDILLSDDQTEGFERAIARRAAHEPVAYILGHKEFFGLDLLVDRRALVPRPSTEVLVEKTLGLLGIRVGPGIRLRPDPGPAPFIVEAGSGSGAAAVALATYLPSAAVLASDISLPAARVALENVHRLGLRDRVHVVVADLQPATAQPPDVLVANLPYVPTDELNLLAPDVRDFEPRIALDGGPDGFAGYRRLIAAAVVRPGGAMLCEIGHQHGPAMRAAVAARAPHLNVEIHPDLEGWDRVAIVTGWR